MRTHTANLIAQFLSAGWFGIQCACALLLLPFCLLFAPRWTRNLIRAGEDQYRNRAAQREEIAALKREIDSLETFSQRLAEHPAQSIVQLETVQDLRARRGIVDQYNFKRLVGKNAQ